MKKNLNTLLILLLLGLTGNLWAQRNCGSMDYLEHQHEMHPEREQRLKEIERHTARVLESASRSVTGTITIPVVVHVVYNNATENISAAQVQSQIDILNEDFRRLNADAVNTPSVFQGVAADVEIEFCLATVDPQGNPTDGITRTPTSVTAFGTNDEVKFNSSGGKDAWPASDYMNFWVCDISGGILGYAQFPGGPASTDGVVVDYQYFGDIGTATAPYDKGRTGTHEVGHYLNLRHIWGDGNCNADDFVSDTPRAGGPNYTGSPCNFPGSNSCNGGTGDLPDMFQNYMDYSDDGCMNLFTQGQTARMRALFEPGGARASLLNSTACGTPVTPTCNDGIQNGDETGVDCGGSHCPPCAVPCADPGFTSNTITPSADGAASVYAMDLDGDGDADVLSASLDDDKIAWYENDGSGNFGAQQVITTSADGAWSVYAMDLDGDGDADVLSASSLDDKIAWYENDGSGNFGAQQVITTSANDARSVYAMDLDGDGDADVLSASWVDDKIAWYENDGSGNFGAQQVITTSANEARSVYAMDLDGDGDADVLSASSLDDKIAWYENDGSGNFGAQQVITTSADIAWSVYAMDLDGDGDADVLSASLNDDKIAWYENDGSGNFGAQQVITTSADAAISVYAMDLDGDGDADVLSASYDDDKIAWYENDGSGNFGAQQVITTSADGAISVYAMDLDGDGDADVLSASSPDNKIAWYENDCVGTCPIPENITITNDCGGEVVLHWDITDPDTLVQSYTVVLDTNGQEFTSYTGLTTSELTIPAGTLQPGTDYEYTITSSCGANTTGVIDGTEIRDPLPEIIISNVVQPDCQGNDAGGFDVTVTDDCGAFYDISVGATTFFNVPAGATVTFIDLEGTPTGMTHQVNIALADAGPCDLSVEEVACLNAVTASELIYTADTSPPDALCANTTVFFDASGQASINPQDVDGGSTDDCATVLNYAIDQSQFTCSDAPEVMVQLEVGDGNPATGSGTCMAAVTLIDDLLPSAVCQDLSIDLDGSGMASVSPQDVDGGSTDNCGVASLTLDITQFSSADIGQNQVILTAEDAAGNLNSCLATVTVNGAPPNCSDGIQNGDETGVDCGGSNCQPCSTPCTNPDFSFSSIASPVSGGGFSIFPADLDGDGDLDALTASANGIGWNENDGLGNFGFVGSGGLYQVATTGARSIHASDLDGDGDLDVVGAHNDKIAWYENDGSGIFGTPQEISTLVSDAQSVYAADLDSDGDMDVLSASFDDNKIAWYENDGSGGFGTQQVIRDLSDWGARSVYASDLDGDGDIDVLAAFQTDNLIEWYENDGSGNFMSQGITSSALGAWDVYASDLDADGDMDVLSASVSDAKIAWYENTGAGNFGNPQEITTQAVGATSVYAVDLDGDGDIDVLSASLDNKIAWYENNGNSTFGQQQLITTSAETHYAVSAADLDGDGDPDILSASESQFASTKFAWYENDCVAPCPIPENITITYNCDGEVLLNWEITDPDAQVQSYDVTIEDNGQVIASYAGQTTTDLTIPPGTLQTGTNYDLTITSSCGVTAMSLIDGMEIKDRLPTITISNVVQPDCQGNDAGGFDVTVTDDCGAFYNISVGATTFFNVPAGATVTFIDLEGTPTGMTHQVNIVLADAGLCDLSVEEVVCLNAVTASELIYTADTSPPNALCANTTVFFDASGQASINPQDVDGGSTDDCATVLNYAIDQSQFTCSDAPEVMVQLEVGDGTGSGTCMAAVTLIDDLLPSAVCQDLSIDLDGSGIASVSPQDVDGGSTDNCGVASLTLDITQFSSADIGQNQVILTAEDAAGNLNSCLATVTVNGAPPNCSDGIQNGDETGVDCGGSNCPPCSLPCLSDPAFNQVIISEDLLFPTTVQGADFDGDGDEDVLVSYYSETHLAWHENNGDGTFGTLHTVLIGAVPYFAHAADLDGDLDADILCSFDGSGVYWFENLGSGSFSSLKTITSSLTAYMIQTADLDEDGVPDVIFPAVGANEIRWHKNFGNGSISTNGSVVSSVAGDVRSVFPADIDGDGDTDILAGSLTAQNDNNLVWYENLGFGSFDPTPKVIQSIPSVGPSISVFSIDLDNDNDVDVIYGHTGMVAWHENLGNGTFGSHQVLNNNPGTVEFVYAEDLTGDGLPDVLSASEYNISWYKNLGSGAFDAPETIQTITGSSGNNFDLSHLDVADVNGDGYFDLLSATTVDHTVAWYDNACIGTPDCPSPDAFTITTLQAAPPLVLDEDGEWFRVYNPTDTDYDLQGYTIKDDGTDSHPITTSLLLPAGGSITLGNNADTLTNGGVHIDYAYGSDITLDDEEDEIVLVCSGTEVARAAYSGGLFAGCTNPTVALGADGTVSITPAQVEDGTMALDGLAGLWLDVTDFDCSNQGQDNPVELTVVDTDGDTSTCMANVSVIDNMAPTAVCADITIALDSAGVALLVADSLDGGSTDNCATIFTYEASQVAFSCDDLGEQSVTLTVSDGSPDAESGNCTATVTVVDDAAPVAECQDAAVQLDAAGMATLSPEAVNNGSYDNCTPAAGLALEVSQDQFDCGDLGQQTVSLFVSDGSPNSGSGSCMAMVTVEDLLPPQAECTDVTVELDDDGMAFLPSFNVDGGSSDNCGTLDLALSQSSFDCTHLGENAVDMIVSDGSNNQDTCTATITVEDVISPVAVCQPFSVSLDSTGSASITADSVDGGSTDNCAGVSLMLNQSTFDCGDIGTNTVTLTVTDASNNSDACQATVTVTDDLPPQALCADISVALDSIGQAMITTDLIGGASTDNCGAPGLSLSQVDFDCSHIGANTVVLTATDGSNNTDTCTATVTVQDLMAPEAVCMAVTVQLDTMGAATLNAAAVGSNSTDNCVSVDLQLDENSFDCSQLGVNTVTLTVTDGSNNTDICTAEITVEDLVPPIASCEPMLALELDPSGQASLSAAEVDAGSFDNCTVADLSIDQTEFSCTDLGMQTVELTVTDNSGNTSACTTNVQITDVSKPFALCQDIEADLGPDGTLTLDGSSLDGGSLDNCGVATLTPNPSQLTCSDIGFNTVILTVADASGNFSTCVSSVSLIDNTPPNAVCVPSFTLEVDPESASPAIISATDLDSGSFDNCGIAQLSVDLFAFTCSDIGSPTPVTLTVMDDNGLESSCTSMVTVVNALEGQACDDGDDCTENDSYDANCNCAGTLIDEDNNGVCDFNECTSPINLQVSNITANTADLSWTAVGPAIEYLVRYRVNGGIVLNALATSESITLTGLPGSAQIEWRVRAICDSGQSSFSSVDAFMTLEDTCPDADGDGVCDEDDLCPEIDDALIGQPCDDGDPCTINDTYGSDCVCYGALFDENNNGICDLNETGCIIPENLQVFSITPDMATLTWNAVIGADSYRVGYITPGQSGTVMLVNTNMVTLTGLSPESEYLWQVRANCGTDNSDNVEGPSFTTSAAGCPDADGDGVCDGDDLCPDFDDMLIGSSCNDYDNCTTNDVVTADCECVGTLIDNNNNEVCDLDELCAPPSNFVTNALSPTSGTVAWDPVPGAVAYQLQYLIAGFGTGNTQLSDTVYTFEGLPPGSIIQWRVRTLCTNGNSSWEVGPALPLPNSLDGGGGAALRTGDRLPPVDWEQVSRELSELQFDIFPNPARDEASLVLSRQAEGTEAVVYNLWGQELARYRLDGVQVQMLNVSEWRAQNTAVVVVLFEPGQPPKTKKLLLVR